MTSNLLCYVVAKVAVIAVFAFVPTILAVQSGELKWFQKLTTSKSELLLCFFG